MDYLTPHIESLIFISDHALSFSDIKNCLEARFETKFSDEAIYDVIQKVTEKFQGEEHAIEIVEVSEGYQFMTKALYHDTISVFLKQASRKKLSKSALETLSIVAYKQPVAKSEIEGIRGVNCDYSIQKLLEKELVEITGRSDGPGRPLLYATSTKFMDHFGLRSLKDLPKIKDLGITENQIGEPSPITENFPEQQSVSDEEE